MSVPLDFDGTQVFSGEYEDYEPPVDPKINEALGKLLKGLHVGSMIGYVVNRQAIERIRILKSPADEASARVKGVTKDQRRIVAMTHSNPKWYFDCEEPDKEVIVHPDDILSFNWI